MPGPGSSPAVVLRFFFGGGVAQVMKATGVDAKKGEQYFSGVSKINKKKRKAPERSEKQTKKYILCDSVFRCVVKIADAVHACIYVHV